MSFRDEYWPEDEFADAEASTPLPNPETETVQIVDTQLALGSLLDKKAVTSHFDRSEVEQHRYSLCKSMVSRIHSGVSKIHTQEQKIRLAEKAESLDGCHEVETVKLCTGCRKVTRFWNKCNLLYCPQCSPGIASDRLKALAWWVDSLKKPKHLVLTLRNVPRLTKGYVSQAKKWLGRFRRCKLFAGVEGGLWAMEITNKGRGWHLHFHLVIEAPWMDVRQISERWSKTTKGAGEVVWIEDASRGGLRANLPRYVTKYTGKGFKLHEWDGDKLCEFLLAMDGGRTFGVFGSLLSKRGDWKQWLAETRAARRKCECGCSDAKFYSPLEFQWSSEGPPAWPKLKPIPPPRDLGQFRWRF
jgi:hypothetical protein